MNAGTISYRTFARGAALLLLSCTFVACSGGGGGSAFGSLPGQNLSNNGSTVPTATPGPTNTPGTVHGPGSTAAPTSPGATAPPSGTPTSPGASAPPVGTGPGTPAPGSSATPHPTATPTAHPTAAPTANPTSQPANATVYDPAVDTEPYFPGNPFSNQVPNPPTVNSNSAAWVSHMNSFGTFALGALTITTNPALNYGFPIYLNHAGSNTPVKIHCTANFGGSSHPCNTEGMTVYIDTRMAPQSGGCTATPCEKDYHLGIIDSAAGYEYDFWQVQWPPQNGVLTAAWAGRCSLSGNGFTNPSYTGPAWNANCASDASKTPLSMGTIRAKDLVAAVQNGGVLPQALNYAFACNGTGNLPAPFGPTGDGTCSGYAPEGSHLYLAMHDADVNALGLPAITSVMLRTMDEDHHGAYVVDTDGCNCNQIQFNWESDNTYAAFGEAPPYLTQVQPMACSEGLPGACNASNGAYEIRMAIPSSVGAAVRFL